MPPSRTKCTCHSDHVAACAPSLWRLLQHCLIKERLNVVEGLNVHIFPKHLVLLPGNVDHFTFRVGKYSLRCHDDLCMQGYPTKQEPHNCLEVTLILPLLIGRIHNDRTKGRRTVLGGSVQEGKIICGSC